MRSFNALRFVLMVTSVFGHDLSIAKGRSEVVARSATTRAATTNDPLMLRGVDGRGATARRYRDVAIALADDLGGQDKLSNSAKILVRHTAALTVKVEALQGKIVAGEDIDTEQLVRLTNTLARTLHRLGLKKTATKAKSILVTLAEGAR
jgi:hypothetical protein